MQEIKLRGDYRRRQFGRRLALDEIALPGTVLEALVPAELFDELGSILQEGALDELFLPGLDSCPAPPPIEGRARRNGGKPAATKPSDPAPDVGGVDWDPAGVTCPHCHQTRRGGVQTTRRICAGLRVRYHRCPSCRRPFKSIEEVS
jgi:hypothetical protein